MKEIAIIGPTASGKSALAVEVAIKHNAYILSLDSLSIYKEVDIASAKPTLEEREGIVHFGIDVIRVDEKFNVVRFFDIYKEAKSKCIENKKNLVIVGGSSFYLKSMIEGITSNINITYKIKKKVKERIQDLSLAYDFIKETDDLYAKKIANTDRYRIEKWYEIFLSKNKVPSEFFLQNSRKPIIKDIRIYNIEVNREILRKKIDLRTQLMINNGLIEEVYYLEKKYGRNNIPLKAIGLIETLKYLDGKVDLKGLRELITINTSNLAKRQITFNNSQFPNKITDIKNNLKSNISF